MTATVIDLFEDTSPPAEDFAKMDKAKMDAECWKVFEYLRSVGRPACKAEIALQAKVDLGHVSQRIERGRNKLGMQLVGGKSGFGQEKLPLCECCRRPASVGRQACKGQQLYVLVSPDLLTLAPRDVGVHIYEEGGEVTVDLETYEITDTYDSWEKERLSAMLRQTFARWKVGVGKAR